jgi:hypothetical protein
MERRAPFISANRPWMGPHQGRITDVTAGERVEAPDGTRCFHRTSNVRIWWTKNRFSGCDATELAVAAASARRP